MTQSYADRVDARPAYARYKNRKKYLRRLVAVGRISLPERMYLQAQAYAIYQADVGKREPTAWSIGAEWVSENGVEKLADPDCYIRGMEALHRGHANVGCKDVCIGATGLLCTCPCGGANHGAAQGRDPNEVRWTRPKERHDGR